MTVELMDELSRCKQPLFKLKWHYRQQDFTPGCILDHAMRSVSSAGSYSRSYP